MTQQKFLSEVLKSSNTIGAWSPSSSFLAKKMLKPIRFKDANCIVEYGPGTGVFTEKLLEKMHPNSMLIIFEINEVFFEELKKIKDTRLIVVNDSAEKIDHYLLLNNQKKADYIISSLPFAMIPEDIVDEILKNSFNSLSEKGKFIQFQYSLNALSKLKKIYTKVKIKFTFLNLPPAFVFVCSK